MRYFTEGKIRLEKLKKGYIIHLSHPLGFSSELALTNKELLTLEKLITQSLLACLTTQKVKEEV